MAIVSALISLAIRVAIAVAINLVANALRKKPKAQTDALDFEQTIQRRLNNGQPLEVLCGRRIVAGIGMFDDSYGPNLQYGVSITASSAVPCTGFHRLFLDGEPVDLSGDPTTGEVDVISHFLGKNDAPRVKVRIFLGDDNSGLGEYLNAKFPSKFTAEDDFGNYCIVVIQCQNTNDDLDEDSGENLIPFQGYPDMKVELSGAKICDPREVGADYEDPSTYIYSDNAALIDAQIDYGFYSGDPGSEALIVGNGYPVELMNLAQIIANADYCDTEGFTCAGLIRSGRNDDQSEVQKCYNAERVEHAAAIFSIPEGLREDIGTVDMSLYPAAFVSDYDPNGFSTEVYNEVKTTYSEPAEYYGEKDLPIYSDPAWLAADNHIPRQLALPLLFVTSLEQAAKLQKQEIEMSRSPATCVIQDFPFDFIGKDVGTIFTLTNCDISELNNRTWIIKGRGQTERGDVTFSLREYGGTQAFSFDPGTETPTVPVNTPPARPWPWWGNEEYISADVIDQVNDAIQGIDTSSIRDTLLSTILRLDEMRRNLGQLGMVDGKPIGTTFTQAFTQIEEANESLVSLETQFTAQLNDAVALINTNQTASADGDSALASDITQLRVQLRDANAELVRIEEAYVDGDEATVLQINALRSEFDNNIALIIQQLDTLTQADVAEATARQLLEATVGANTARIASEERARADADTAAAAVRDLILSQVGQNTAAIAVEQTTRADADEAITNTLTQQQSAIEDVTADFQNEVITRTNQFASLVTETTLLRARIEDAEAGQSGTASQLDTLEVRVDRNENNIVSVSNQISGVASTAASAYGRAIGNSQSINALGSRVTAAENSVLAQAQSLSQVEASVNQTNASVAILAQAQADSEGNADSALVFRVVGGGNEAVIQTLAGTTYGSQIIVDADVFRIRGNAVVEGTLTAAAFVGEGISINQDFTGGSAAIPSNGSYGRTYSGTLRSKGRRHTVVGTVEVEFPLYNGGADLAAWIQLRVGGIVRKTVYFSGASGWPHTIPIAAPFTLSGNAPIEVWVRVIRNSAFQGVSGARMRSCTLIAQEMQT
jgi:hypothetical protein